MPATRKRHRSSFVCTFCKRRKTRCDKGNPCGTCIKYGNPNCEYVIEKTSNLNRSDESLVDTSSSNGSNGIMSNTDVPLFNSGPLVSTPSTTSQNMPLSPLSRNSGSVHHESSPHTSSVELELEMLRKKISFLEKSVKQDNPKGDSCVWMSNSDDFSYFIGYYPSEPEVETFSFHSRFNPFLSVCPGGTRNYGPLSWNALINIDNALAPLINYKRKSVQRRRKFISSFEKGMEPSDRLFVERVKKTFEDDKVIDGPNGKSFKAQSKKIDDDFYERSKAFGLTSFRGEINPDAPLLEKITIMLQTKKVIWLLLDQFFKEVVMLFPFIDELEFLDHMERILGPRSYAHERVSKLNCRARSDLVQLGILLIVLRFSYLSMFTNSDAINEQNLYTNDLSPQAQTKKFLMNNPIDIDYLDLAEACLHQFNIFKSCTLPLLQLALFIKRYYLFSPENGEVPEDSHSQSYTAMLINMAISLGLHREPDNVNSQIRDQRTNNLCRKIWAYLLILDFEGAVTNGLPLSVSKQHFDTKMPYHKPGNENIKDLESEKTIIASFSRIELGYGTICQMIEMITNLEPISMEKLTGVLSEMEVDFIKDYTSFSSSLNEDLTKQAIKSNAIKMKIYFQSTFFIVSVNFHFFILYESRNNADLAYFYLKKIFVIAIHDMLPLYERVIGNKNTYFRGTSDLAITPSLQSLIHKCLVVILAVIIRARFSILFFENLSMHTNSYLTDPKYKRRYDLMLKTYELATKCNEVFVNTLAKLSSRYYYSWRCVKAQKHLMSMYTGTEYFEEWCKGKECYMKFTNEMLEDFNGLLEKSLERVSPKAPVTVSDNQNKTAATDICTVPTNLTDVPIVLPETTGADFQESQEIDNLWMQMLGKPKRGQDSFYSRTPPLMDVGLAPLEELLGNMDDNFNFPGPYDGFNLFEPTLDEISAANIN